MNFIKNNKVFIFLFLCLSIFISTLAYLLVKGEDTIVFPFYNDEYSVNEISYFNGSFDEDRMGVELLWDVHLASSSIEKFELYQDGNLLRTGKNSSSAILSMKDYDFISGNNKFDLYVTLKNGTIMNKTAYVYIDEVFNFNVTERISDNKIIYTVTYYYDKRKPAGSLYMHLYDITQPFSFNYVSSKSEPYFGNIVKGISEYELVYTEVEKGRYELLIEWEFIDHNISFNSTSSFDVVGGTNES